MLARKAPYQVEVLGSKFISTDINVYPTGKLTAMCALCLIGNILIRGKTIADIGAGCFTLGVLAAKSGAKKVIGVDISSKAVQCVRENILINNAR